MKKIELSNSGNYTLVDDEDYEFLLSFNWVERSSKTKSYAKSAGIPQISMHRLLLRPPKDKVVDHINGNSLDNRKENLRICTAQQNVQNNSGWANTTSKYKCVYKKGNKWAVSVKNKNLGIYDNEFVAGVVADYAARKEYGKYAWLNFPSIKNYDKFEKYINYAYSLNSSVKGENNPTAIVTEEIVQEIRELYKNNFTQSEIGRLYNIDNRTIYAIVQRKNWDYLDDNPNVLTQKLLNWATKNKITNLDLRGKNKKTHCKYGHEYTEENTYVNKQNKRNCRLCSKEKSKISQYKNRTHCPNGHEYTDNNYKLDKMNRRRCLLCNMKGEYFGTIRSGIR